jgi:hypothetical protein
MSVATVFTSQESVATEVSKFTRFQILSPRSTDLLAKECVWRQGVCTMATYYEKLDVECVSGCLGDNKYCELFVQQLWHIRRLCCRLEFGQVSRSESHKTTL